MVNMREFGGNPKFEYREIPSFGATFIFTWKSYCKVTIEKYSDKTYRSRCSNPVLILHLVYSSSVLGEDNFWTI